VHDEAELDRAVAAGADLIGVNQRDLRTFAVDRTLAARLVARLPAGVVTVAESGVRTSGDIPPGVDAVLVGETLVTSSDPTAAIRELRGAQP
jgi:indole-3-glycerol phosphate synthase